MNEFKTPMFKMLSLMSELKQTGIYKDAPNRRSSKVTPVRTEEEIQQSIGFISKEELDSCRREFEAIDYELANDFYNDPMIRKYNRFRLHEIASIFEFHAVVKARKAKFIYYSYFVSEYNKIIKRFEDRSKNLFNLLLNCNRFYDDSLNFALMFSGLGESGYIEDRFQNVVPGVGHFEDIISAGNANPVGESIPVGTFRREEQLEKFIIDTLMNENTFSSNLNIKRQETINGGRIDILVENAEIDSKVLIELKLCTASKSAIYQVASYLDNYPGAIPVVIANNFTPYALEKAKELGVTCVVYTIFGSTNYFDVVFEPVKPIDPRLDETLFALLVEPVVLIPDFFVEHHELTKLERIMHFNQLIIKNTEALQELSGIKAQ